MERLWAPWRMQYVEGSGSPQGCIFCDFPSQEGDEADRSNLVLGRTSLSFVMLNRFPYTSGHLLVVPRRHTATFEELPGAELDDLGRLLQRSVERVRRLYRPDGVNLGMNVGRSAGAGIADHLHWHVVPRWTGDTNFMPVVGETRVMVEELQKSWERLRPLFGDE